MPNSNLSYWEKSSYLSQRDVVIIGSGIVGLNAAITIKEKNPSLSVLILERGALPMGASTKNAGFACFGSVSELLDDLEKESEEQVFSLVERRWKGLMNLRQKIGDAKLVYESLGGYELFTDRDDPYFEECESKINYLNKSLDSIIGLNETYSVRDDKIDKFGFEKVKHIICNSAEGQIDTGQMMVNLEKLARSKGVEILTGFEVLEIREELKLEIVMDVGLLKARKVIVATNGFAQQLLPAISLQPARNQVLITQPISNLKVKGCFHYDKGYYYFRNIHNRILFGGGRNLDLETESTTEMRTTLLIETKLKEMLEEIILPNTDHSIAYMWSGILGVGHNKVPIINALSDRLFCAVKMGGMGIAIGCLVGEEVAELLLERV